MTLKVGVAQIAAPTSVGTVDLTNSSAGFSSDVKAALIFSSYATANNTLTGESQISLGLVAATGGTTERAIATTGQDAVGTPNEGSKNISTKAFLAMDNTGASVDIANASAFLSNGLTLNFTTVSGRARLVNALLFGGDIQAKVVTLTWDGVSGIQSAAHGLSGAPGLVIGISNNKKLDAAPDTSSRINMGFWDGTTAVGYTRRNNDVGNVQACVEALDATHWLMGAVGDTATVSADTTNVSVTALNSMTQTWYLLCIYGVNLKAKAGFFTCPTGSGDADTVSSLAFDPQVALCLGTRQTALNSVTTDLANVFSLGAAALHSGTISQGSIAESSDDGAGSSGSPLTTTRKNWTSNTKHIRIPNDTGTDSVVATLSAFGTAKITHNFTGVNLAQEVMYLLAQETTSAGGAAAHPLSGKLKGLLGGKLG